MYAIFKKEINAFLSSLVGYVVLGAFLVAMGLFVWVFPDTSVLTYGLADLSAFFNLAPFLFIFLVPAVTMRAFAEERKGGTLELLFTKPVSIASVVLGKFFACVTLLVIGLIPTLVYYFSVVALGNPTGNIDSASVAGAYVGLVLLGSVFVAVGLFTSSLTDSQVVAFVLGVFVCFTGYVGLSSLAGLDLLNNTAYWLGWLGWDTHYAALGKGVLDSRNIIYLLSLVVLALVGTQRRLAVR